MKLIISLRKIGEWKMNVGYVAVVFPSNNNEYHYKYDMDDIPLKIGMMVSVWPEGALQMAVIS